MKYVKSLFLLCIILLFALTGCQNTSKTSENSTTETTKAKISLEGHTLMVYCGAGMTNPFNEITTAFKEETGCEINVTYANAGQIQTQIATAQEGDLFIAGSADELTPVKDYVSESTNLVKHIPVLAVQKGNPKNITSLNDLANGEIKVVLGESESTPIGKIADKALSDAGILANINVVARTTTAPALSTALEADEADATIIWKENANKLDIVNTTDLDKYVKTVPAATLSFNKDADALEAFLEFLDTDTVKNIWINYGYEIVE